MNEIYINKWKSQLKKGTLSFMVLHILKGNEYYGYELIENIKNRAKVAIAEGTLYPLMNRLKDEGLVTAKWVEQESGIPRKYYCLTEQGEETLGGMQQHWETIQKTINQFKSQS
ncbi:MAG: PadR family transcriptional regulator [Nonlabens sp.]|nr:PadR family transcriptional regulator [Nonlabens sp.]